MIKNDKHQLELDINAVLIADLGRYKKSLIFECVTGKREVA